MQQIFFFLKEKNGKKKESRVKVGWILHTFTYLIEDTNAFWYVERFYPFPYPRGAIH
jgi:hypothetical protein